MMATKNRRIKNSAVFICDIQEKFRSAIFEFDKVVHTAQKVLKTAQALSIPIYATTQNRARLGDTVPELASLLDASGPLVRTHSDKTKFSMWTPEVESRLNAELEKAQAAAAAAAAASPARSAGGDDSSSSSSSSQEFDEEEMMSVAIVGIESHICVTQTALDLLREGHAVYILADGVSSCNREEVPLALDRLRNEGAVVTSSESWMYEVMGDAAVPEFRGIVGLVKASSASTKTALQALLPAKM